METAFGDFRKLTDAFVAAAVNPRAGNVAAEATSSVGALSPFAARILALQRACPSDQLWRPTSRPVGRARRAPSKLARTLAAGVACDFDFTTAEQIARNSFYKIRLGAMGGEVPQTSRGAFSLTRHQPSRSQAAWGAMPNWDLAPVVSGFEKAALDPSLWPSVLHDLSVRVGAQGAVLLSTDWRLPGNSVSPRGRGTDRQLLQEWLARG